MTPKPFDLFISYAHRDNRGNPGDAVSVLQALKQAIKREYHAVTGRDVSIFLDTEAITTGSDWRGRILEGLKQSKMLLACVSENYFRSEYCRLEWEHYIQTELAQAIPGEGITPIYIVRCPEFDSRTLDARLQRWARDLTRRQVDRQWLDWWPHGQAALERDDVRKRLRELAERLHTRRDLYERREQSPTNQMPLLTEHFQGRLRELHELRRQLVKGNIGAITAVNGVPGIGKTELALAYAWGYGGHYPGGRFYLNLAGQFRDDTAALDNLQQQIANLAEFKGIAVSDLERQTPGAVYRKVIRAFAERPDEGVLFLLDNVDDPRLVNAALLARALPQGASVDVIITTRLSQRAQNKLEWVAVDQLEPEEGVALLDSFVPIPESPEDREWKGAWQIARGLGGHALALTVLGVSMRWKGESSYVRVRDQLEREGLLLVSTLGEELEQEQIPLDSAYTERVVARLLQPTLDHLRTSHPAAYRALQLAAFCPPDEIAVPWLTDLLVAENPEWGVDRMGGPLAEQAIRRLIDDRLLVPVRRQRAGLVSELGDIDSRVVRIHRVYAALIEESLPAEETAIVRGRLFTHARQRAKSLRSTWGAPGLGWEVLPLAAFTDMALSDETTEIVRLADDVCEMLRHLGRLADVQRLRMRNCEILERLLRGAPYSSDYARDLSVSYERMGDLWRSLGDGAQTLRYYEQALQIRDRLSQGAPDNADYARGLSVSYNRLGDLWKSLGDGAQALRYYEQALQISERLLQGAPDNAVYARDLGISYERLGELWRFVGDGAQARRYNQYAVQIRERLFHGAPNNADYARDLSISYERMGTQWRSLGDGAQTRWYYEQALQIAERLSQGAPDNADYAQDLSISYERMGDLWRSLGDGAQALRYYEQALQIRDRLFHGAPNNAAYAWDLSISYERMGTQWRSLGDGARARSYYEQEVQIRERLSRESPDHADYVRGLSMSYGQLGDLWRSLGDGAHARRYYDQALQIAERLSQGAPDNAEFARDLGVIYERMGDLWQSLRDGVQALRYYEQALQIRERRSQGAPDNADYARDLGVIYERMGDLWLSLRDGAQALRYYEQALQIRERQSQWASNNPDYARDLGVIYERLGNLWRSLGDRAQARRYYEQVLQITERLSRGAPDNADYARDLDVIYERLGDLLRSLGDGAQARRYYEQALQIRERLLQGAPDNAHYARALNVIYERMGDLCGALGDGAQARRYYEQAVQIRERLSQGAPDNADYARDLSISYDRLGDLWGSLGDGAQARRYYEQALQIRERLSQGSPDNVQCQVDLAGSLARIAQCEVDPRPPLYRALDILETLERTQRLSPADQPKLLVLREVVQQLGDDAP